MPSSEYASRSGGIVIRPYCPDLPRMPDFSAGRCASPSASPDWWTSSDPQERQAAIWACKSCPVLAACAEWSLSLPSTDTTGIFGAMTAGERVRTRRERQAAAQAAAEAAQLAVQRGMPKINSEKMACIRGHDISPGSPHLRIGKGRDGRPMRVCLACKRIRRRLALRRREPQATA